MAGTEDRRDSGSRRASSNGRSRSDSNGRSRNGRSRSANNGRSRSFSAADAARRAREELEELTQTPVERVTGVRRNEEDGWVVELEGIELQRIPPTMDVLGSYEIELSDRGDVMAWRRVGRHHRSQVE